MALPIVLAAKTQAGINWGQSNIIFSPSVNTFPIYTNQSLRELNPQLIIQPPELLSLKNVL
jgi:hypothetical protein